MSLTANKSLKFYGHVHFLWEILDGSIHKNKLSWFSINTVVNVTIQLMDNHVRLPGRWFSKLYMYCPLCLRFHSDQVFQDGFYLGAKWSGGVIRRRKHITWSYDMTRPELHVQSESPPCTQCMHTTHMYNVQCTYMYMYILNSWLDSFQVKQTSTNESNNHHDRIWF